MFSSELILQTISMLPIFHDEFRLKIKSISKLYTNKISLFINIGLKYLEITINNNIYKLNYKNNQYHLIQNIKKK